MAALFPCIQTPSYPTSWPWSPGFIIVLLCNVSPFGSRCLDFLSEGCVSTRKDPDHSFMRRKKMCIPLMSGKQCWGKTSWS